MAALNLEKAIEKGYKIMDSKYCLRFSDIVKLGEKDLHSAITAAFAVGYLQGAKATKHKMAEINQ